ncbi:copper chaperone PCu(A)C [Allomesorhizobium alhagi]|jgi:periplasmic copper chaperone A|uniref:Copper chaperone PCu(A)C n=1 Tax=Mesorhizobium alhagi CCNWXJ12-2 TaxID=1107882 RepID=H0I1S3_9HYPH|nr:copper chaperone PCu(A)C [Mesorhizobium alhagi]EHK53063.1 hypothetical protein MAXJ12_32054 [Mesorhizobium alhagi CCNWXJ12-2]
MAKYHLMVVLATVTAAVVECGATLASAHDEHGTHAISAGPAEIRDAWSPPSPPGIGTRAVYFTLVNTACAPLKVIGAESLDFAQVSIHESSTRNGIAMMTPATQLTLTAGETVSFAPGGLHLMLMGASRNFHEGEHFRIRLIFDDQDSLVFEATVGGAAAGGNHDHHRQHKDGHPDHPLAETGGS